MAEGAQIQEIQASNAELVNTLVSDAFLYKKPHQFFQDFPIWGSDQVRRFGAFEGQKLVSHVGIRLAQIGAVRVGLIGAVATHAAHRGQGHSTRLLEHTIKFAESQGAEWLVLWGSEHEFYSKFGFALAGIQTRIRLADLLKAKPGGLVPVNSTYNPKIFDTLVAHQSAQQIALAKADAKWFERHQTVKWFWTPAPFAFVGFERGMDLPHMVHEWGGDARSVLGLLQQVYKQDSAAEILLHPSQLAQLGLTPDIVHVNEHLCLAKPMNGQQAWPDEYWISGLNSC